MNKHAEGMSLRNSIKYSVRMLTLVAKVRLSMLLLYAIGAISEIGASIISLYATARIVSYLAQFIANGNAGHVWLWLWIDISSAAVIALSFLAMSSAKRILYFDFTKWSVDRFTLTLARIDLESYYDENIRNQINKVGGGYTWQLSNLASSNLDLYYGILRFVAMTLVVSQITWWLVPIIALFLIPTLMTERRTALMQWFVWDLKGDERHIFWGLESIFRQVKGQMELRSLQANDFVRNKLNQMNTEFYASQEAEYRKFG